MLSIATIPGVLAAIAILTLTLQVSIKLQSPIGFVAWAVHASLFAYQVTFGGFLIEFWLAGVLSIAAVSASGIMASRM